MSVIQIDQDYINQYMLGCHTQQLEDPSLQFDYIMDWCGQKYEYGV